MFSNDDQLNYCDQGVYDQEVAAIKNQKKSLFLSSKCHKNPVYRIIE